MQRLHLPWFLGVGIRVLSRRMRSSFRSALVKMDTVALRKHLVGTWLLPETRDHTSTISLSHEGWMRMTIASASWKERFRQQLSGDLATGNWRTSMQRPTSPKSSSARSSSSLSSSFRPPLAGGAGNRADEQGPFLVLNVLDVPRSIANVRIFGVKADIANWAMTLDELAGGRFFKICDYSDPALLTLSAGDGIMEQWGRIQ